MDTAAVGGREVTPQDAPGSDPEELWRQARERDLLERHLPGVMLTIGAFEALMAVRNYFAFTGPAHLVMPALQAVAALLFLGGWWRLRGAQVSPRSMGWVIPAVVVILGFMVSLEQALTGHGLLAANTAMVMVVAGALVLRLVTYLVTTGLLVLGWLVALSTHTVWDVSPVDQATLLVVAGVVGAMVHGVRAVDRRSLVSYARQAHESGLHDQLTGLWNRRGARDVWPVLAANAQQEGTSTWCIFIDVRGLKAVNDRLGHATGDVLLGGIGDALRETVPRGVVATRWGGDEFCLFGQHEHPGLEELECDVRAQTERRIGLLDQPWDVSAGLAVAPAEVGDEALWRLVEAADDDMYRRRSLGTSQSGSEH